MSPEVRNILNYALVALGAFVLGAATALVPQLMDPTMPDINWRIVLGTGISALVAAGAGSRLPRVGETALATQVDHLRASSVPTDHLIVVDAGTKREAATVTRHAEQALAGKAPEPVDHSAHAGDA